MNVFMYERDYKKEQVEVQSMDRTEQGGLGNEWGLSRTHMRSK